MPLISLSTNSQKLDSEDAKKAFVSKFSEFCSETLNKDEKYFNVDVQFNPYLAFGGTFEPAIMLKIVSLGDVTAANSRVWAAKFSAFFETNLGVQKDRGLVAFRDPGPAFVGTRGTTVEALLEESA